MEKLDDNPPPPSQTVYIIEISMNDRSKKTYFATAEGINAARGEGLHRGVNGLRGDLLSPREVLSKIITQCTMYTVMYPPMENPVHLPKISTNITSWNSRG